MKTSRMRRAVFATAALATFTTFAGCATVTTPTKGDPLEGLNRTVFSFNDKVDRYTLKPVAKGYQWAVPRPVRSSVTNFFSNIGDIYNAANNLLQLKIADGAEDIMRVAINTVFGVGGLFDVASAAKLPKHQQDLGLTLGHYGVPNGPYLVLPLIGPSTVRDTVGMVGDHFINPISYLNPDAASWGVYGVQVVNLRANLLGASDLLDSAAIDKYSFMRNAYLQRRNYLLTGGQGSDDAPPPQYDDEGGAAAPATPEAPASSVPGADGASSGAAGATGTPGASSAADAFGASGTSGALGASGAFGSTSGVGTSGSGMSGASSPFGALTPVVDNGVASATGAAAPGSSPLSRSYPASSSVSSSVSSVAPSSVSPTPLSVPSSAGLPAIAPSSSLPVAPASGGAVPSPSLGSSASLAPLVLSAPSATVFAAGGATATIAAASGACSCATPYADGCPAWLMRWCPDVKYYGRAPAHVSAAVPASVGTSAQRSVAGVSGVSAGRPS